MKEEKNSVAIVNKKKKVKIISIAVLFLFINPITLFMGLFVFLQYFQYLERGDYQIALNDENQTCGYYYSGEGGIEYQLGKEWKTYPVYYSGDGAKDNILDWSQSFGKPHLNSKEIFEYKVTTPKGACDWTSLRAYTEETDEQACCEKLNYKYTKYSDIFDKIKTRYHIFQILSGFKDFLFNNY